MRRHFAALLLNALRDYGTATWEGGDSDCGHKKTSKHQNLNKLGERLGCGGGHKHSDTATAPFVATCGKCGAVRVDQQIGLEETPGAYVGKLVEVFAEVRRVLHPSGVCFVNIGDSYNAYNGNRGASTSFSAAAEDSCPDLPAGHGLTVKGCKPKDLLGIPWMLAFALRDDGWFLRSEITLCLSGGAMVYARTQKGDMPCMVKDLVRLNPETVKLWNGQQWTQVVGWERNPRPLDPIEIELRSGERIGCTREHLWPTQRGLLTADRLAVGDTIPLTRLPQREDHDNPEHLPDEEIGWFVGFYLAEGCLTDKSIKFSCHAKETGAFDRIARVAKQFHGTCRMKLHRGNAASINVHGKIILGIIRHYVSGRGSDGKRLTNACWQRSDTFLRAVLDGYLEGDGHYVKDQRQWRLGFTQNDAMASCLRTLCARIGVSIRLRRCFHQCGDKKHPGYRGYIRIEKSDHRNMKNDGEIIAIRPSRARWFWDIEVADDPHLFALASGVLTHNCKTSPMPESVRDRPTQATEKLFLLTKEDRYFYDQEAERVPHTSSSLNRCEPHRSFVGSSDRNGLVARPNQGPNTFNLEQALTPGGRNLWNYWQWASDGGYPEAHFATFPSWLPRRCIRLGSSERGVCPKCSAPWQRILERKQVKRVRPNDHVKRTGENGTGNSCANTVAGVTVRSKGWEPTCTCNAGIVPALILDPFSGAGTTVMVANQLGRRAIGLELNPGYVELSKRRICNASLRKDESLPGEPLPLFAEM